MTVEQFYEQKYGSREVGAREGGREGQLPPKSCRSPAVLTHSLIDLSIVLLSDMY